MCRCRVRGHGDELAARSILAADEGSFQTEIWYPVDKSKAREVRGGEEHMSSVRQSLTHPTSQNVYKAACATVSDARKSRKRVCLCTRVLAYMHAHQVHGDSDVKVVLHLFGHGQSQRFHSESVIHESTAKFVLDRPGNSNATHTRLFAPPPLPPSISFSLSLHHKERKTPAAAKCLL